MHLPTRICQDLQAALRREWLVTNGLGGFASGTVAGPLTRRYHGLLIAALRPPTGRTLLAARFDEAIRVGDDEHLIYTSLWRDGVADPVGWRYLRRFDLIDGVPTWTYEVAGRVLVKQVWMEHGRNVTFLRYEVHGAGPIELEGRLLANYRDYHYLTAGAGPGFQVRVQDARLTVRPDGARIALHAHGATADGVAVAWRVDHTWYRGFLLPIERDRGFDHVEDHCSVGLGRVTLRPRCPVTIALAAGDEAAAVPPADALERARKRVAERLSEWGRAARLDPAQAPVPLRQLVLAADQFIAVRPLPDVPDGHTVVAGYPWFTDWGRDTMIALPGLTLCTGRFALAREILRTWAGFVEQGLIPNRFPDGPGRPEYHTADATLWYLWAIDQYFRATADTATLRELFPLLREIVNWYRRGTRHHIRVGEDGLVLAGEPGLNLTWMDARIGDRAVTPRTGKPIELSALWYDAVCNLARLAELMNQPSDEYVRLAQRTRASFTRFWNPRRHACLDVLDGPHGDDPRLRPNQILAVALTHSPLTREQREQVVQTCERRLLTWFGLRSLAPGEPGYRGHYRGGPVERDEAYHQGTAWGWLLGFFIQAHWNLHRDARRARFLLEPLLGQLWTYGLGSLGEIFDAEEPFAPNGCPAQAWTVAEALRAWHVTQLPAWRRGHAADPDACADPAAE